MFQDEATPIIVGAADIVQNSSATDDDSDDTAATISKAKIKYNLTIEPVLLLLLFRTHMTTYVLINHE